MKRLWMVVPAALVFMASSAMAASTVGTTTEPVSFGSAADHGNQLHKQHAIYALLKKGKQIRLADGGTLTAEHHAQLQHELDAIRAGNY